jgi:hypothetical protein
MYGLGSVGSGPPRIRRIRTAKDPSDPDRQGSVGSGPPRDPSDPDRQGIRRIRTANRILLAPLVQLVRIWVL